MYSHTQHWSVWWAIIYWCFTTQFSIFLYTFEHSEKNPKEIWILIPYSVYRKYSIMFPFYLCGIMLSPPLSEKEHLSIQPVSWTISLLVRFLSFIPFKNEKIKKIKREMQVEAVSFSGRKSINWIFHPLVRWSVMMSSIRWHPT